MGPAGIPEWMDEATYESVAATVEVRIIRIHVEQRGFRTRVLEVVTTLLNAEIYTKKDVGILYRKRWHVELDLRSLKVVLGIDMLGSKTPEMSAQGDWDGAVGIQCDPGVDGESVIRHRREPRG